MAITQAMDKDALAMLMMSSYLDQSPFMSVFLRRRDPMIKAERIDKETNAEVRRAMIERYGYGRYVSKSPIVHQDHTGKLRKRRNRRGDEIAVVEVINGSKEPDGTHKTYFLSVPPTCATAIEAVAWTYGMTAHEYKGLAIRT